MQSVVFPNKILPYFLVAPQIILTVVFFFWPASQALYQSAMREDPFGLQSTFVGFANFSAILADPNYLHALQVTVVFSIATALLSMGVALLLATAADLVQDLFLRFWRRPLVQVEELSTYLLRCAGNIAIDHLRSEGTRTRVNEGWQPDEPHSHGSEPQAALEAGNDLRHVEAALRALPERTRQIFLLNRIHGRKYADIAKAMGLSQSAVEKHMMRALEACKASLREPAPRLPGKAP